MTCLGPAFTAFLLGSGAYVIGSSVGVYAAGRFMDREGSFSATLLGATLGAAGGALLISGDLASGFQVTGLLLLTQVGAIGMYHFTDRVRISATLEDASKPKLAEGSSGSAGKIWSIRPELQVVLARF